MSGVVDRAILFYIVFITMYALMVVCYSPLYVASTSNTTISAAAVANWTNGTTLSVNVSPADFFHNIATFTTDYWFVNLFILAPMPIIALWAIFQYIRGI